MQCSDCDHEYLLAIFCKQRGVRASFAIGFPWLRGGTSKVEMKLVVHGLWHLGSVTAACCARHFDVLGLDDDPARIARLQAGFAPLMEPGLDALIAEGIAAGLLRFTSDVTGVADADLLWVTHDTPVDDADVADVDAVLRSVRRSLPHLKRGTVVLVSAQLPVGTCRQLETEFSDLQFASSPENLRLGKAINAFTRAERVIVGIRTERPRAALEELFKPFTSQVLFMRTESAEMVKHALNSFLALSITFINEVARLCEITGADAFEVSQGLKSEPRIGPKAYLGPGTAFAGATLARDIVTLSSLAERQGETLDLIPAIKRSNDRHRGWALRRLRAGGCVLRGRVVALLGLVYTPGTDTLRRSSAVELARGLVDEGAVVRAFDPAVRVLPAELSSVALMDSVDGAIHGADVLVVCTEWPEFRAIDWSKALSGVGNLRVLDANRYLEKQIATLPGVDYVSVGRPTP